MIKKIKKIKKGILNIDTEQELKTHNLIFGYNGTGKTTLAKIFYQIELNKNFDTTEYKFEVDPSYTNPYIRVFYGEDYIQNNIVGDSRNPIVFSIGSEQVEKKEEKNKLIEKKTKVKQVLDSLQRKITDRNNTIETLKTDKGREIGNLLGLRSYNKTSIPNDLTNFEPKILELKQLSEQDLVIQFTHNKSIYNNKLNKEEMKKSFQNIKNILEEQKENIQTALSLQLQEPEQVEELFNKIKSEYEKQGNSVFQSFIQQGTQFDIFKNNQTCPFCFRELGELFQNFVDYFSKQVEDHQKELSKIKNIIEQAQTNRDSQIDTIPTLEKFFDNKQSEVKSISDNLRTINSNIITKEQEIINLLEQKYKNPYTPIDVEIADIQELFNDLNKKFNELQNIIKAHDIRVTEFEKNRTQASNWIKAYLLIDLKNKIDENKPKIDHLNTAISIHTQTLNQCKNMISKLEREFLNFEPFVDEYNKYIQRILGYADITLNYDTSQNGYVLKRNGQNTLYNTFSEGEKTAIAVIHFILSLKDESKGDIKNCIVVIDDPICSLDTNNLYGIYAYLKQSLKEVKQLFILTHHFYFFKRVQQWFVNFPFYKTMQDGTLKLIKNRDGKKKCIIELFLEKLPTSDTQTYESKLVQMPKELDKYESEYQYLFDRLQKLKKKNTLTYKDCISLPNECRRILESIAIFIEPFEPNHDNRIISIRNEIINFYEGTDDEKNYLEQSLDYIYRHTNTESHLQLFDDSLYFQNNPPEAKKLITAIILFIEKIVPHHLEKYDQQNQTT